jgi:hypothetical protein
MYSLYNIFACSYIARITACNYVARIHAYAHMYIYVAERDVFCIASSNCNAWDSDVYSYLVSSLARLGRCA